MSRLVLAVASVLVALTWAMGCWPLDGSATAVRDSGKGSQPKEQRPRIPFANWTTLATDRSPTARRAAARILANYPRRGMPYLLMLLEDGDARVRLEALRSIEAVVSGISMVAVYGGDKPSMVLWPRGSREGDLAWSGKLYQSIVGPYPERVKRRLNKLEKERPELRALAAEALHELEVRLAAVGVGLKRGRGKALRKDPNGKVTVKVEPSGEAQLTDRRGKRLARLSYSLSADRDPDEEVACWTFSPDGGLLAVGFRYDSLKNCRKDGMIQGYLHLYDPATGELLGEAGQARVGPVTHLAFSADGKTLLYQTGKYMEKGGK